MGAAKYMCLAKDLKSKIWQLRYKIKQKSVAKDFIETFTAYFFSSQYLYATFTKTSKKHILIVALRNYANITQIYAS